MKTEIRLAGTGGQGLILAGVILAEAVGVYEGKKVIQTQSYGPEARGGASKTDVIIADYEIWYPKARQVDVLVCLSQKALDSYQTTLAPTGIIISDNFYVKNCPFPNSYKLPLAIETRNKFGREIFMNIVLLGVLAKITKIVELDSLKKAVSRYVPPVTLENNLQALELGYQIGKDQ